MLKKDLSEKNNTQGGALGQDTIADDDLAKMFIEANTKSASIENTEVLEIFPEVSEVYSHSSHAPDDELRKELSNSLSDENIMHKSLLDAHLDPNFFNQISHKFKKLIFSSSNVVPTQSIYGLDWQYYETYSKIWKKNIKTQTNDTFSYLELFFRNAAKFKTLVQLELLSIFAGFLTAIAIYSWLDAITASTTSALPGVQFVVFLKQLVFGLNTFALIILLLPCVFLMCMWFVNINHLHKSKNFHVFFCSFTFIAYLTFFCLMFTLVLYHVLNFCYGFNVSPIHGVKTI